MIKLITEQDFDNLFNTLVTKVIQNGDQGKRKLFEAISDVYEIKQWIPEITLFEKQEKERLVIFRYESIRIDMDDFERNRCNGELRDYKYEVTTSVDLHTTLNSFNSFFKYYMIQADIPSLIDREAISTIILPAIKRLIKYINKD